MFVISRKRINLIILAVLVGVFSFSYTKEKNASLTRDMEVTSTPVSNKVVVLDSGHGLPDRRSNW